MEKNLIRFGVSMNQKLLERFNTLIEKKNYKNRSEAIRDLVRKELINTEWETNNIIAGAITYTYDHHQHHISDYLMHTQHDFHEIIISTQHVHLDHDNCLEIVAVKGNAKRVKKLSELIISIKGVKHGILSMTTTGKKIP